MEMIMSLESDERSSEKKAVKSGVSDAGALRSIAEAVKT
jgi:hypothetical protein